jgi:ABC-type transport system involved in cytochrome bd biosynthesis fused ATPase/permease subunit
LAGVVLFLVVLMALEWIAHQLFPSRGRLVPTGMLAFVAFAYFLSAALGGAIAARISRQSWTAWVIAILVAAGAAYSLTQLPQPLWMQIASIVAPLLGGLVASRLAQPKPADAAI